MYNVSITNNCHCTNGLKIEYTRYIGDVLVATIKQEYIPVEWAPPASIAISTGGVSGVYDWGVCPGCVCPGGCVSMGVFRGVCLGACVCVCVQGCVSGVCIQVCVCLGVCVSRGEGVYTQDPEADTPLDPETDTPWIEAGTSPRPRGRNPLPCEQKD